MFNAFCYNIKSKLLSIPRLSKVLPPSKIFFDLTSKSIVPCWCLY